MGQSAPSQWPSPTLANLEKLPGLAQRNPSGPKIRRHFFPRTQGSFIVCLMVYSGGCFFLRAPEAASLTNRFFPVILMSNYCQDFFMEKGIKMRRTPLS